MFEFKNCICDFILDNMIFLKVYVKNLVKKSCFQNSNNFFYEVSISSFSSSLFSSSLSESSSSPDDSESSSFKVLMSDSINISHSSNLWISNNYNNVYYTFLLCENYFKNINENILLIFVTLFYPVARDLWYLYNQNVFGITKLTRLHFKWVWMYIL